MPRPHRLQLPGMNYHIFSRGNEKQRIYRDDLDRRSFLAMLGRLKREIGFDLYSYVLMPNHYHFLMRTRAENLGKIMQLLNSRYSMYFNWKYNRVGHLFQGRYKSLFVQDDQYVLDLVRYIHLNPVRKRLVKEVNEYKWSSHPDYVKDRPAKLVDRDYVMSLFGKDRKEALQEYINFLGHGSKPMPESLLNGLAHGSKEFTEKIINEIKKRKLHVPGWQLRQDRCSPECIIQLTADEFKVTVDELKTKRGKWNQAKRAAIYLMWHNTSLSAHQIASYFNNMHPSGVKIGVDKFEE